MSFTVRIGTPADYQEVERVTREAFWNQYFPGCDEHFTMHRLWTHKDFMPDLFFVALDGGGKIVGAIAFTLSRLENDAGERIETATFGPVCVLPERQHEGIGSALIRTGIDAAFAKGYAAVIILGDPHNYCRHGFRNGKDYAISDKNGRFPIGQLVRVRDEQAFGVIPWKFFYSDAYEIDPAEAERFDARLPKKEKRTQPSQVIFGMLIRAYLD